MKKTGLFISICLLILLAVIPLRVCAGQVFSPVWPVDGSYVITSLDYYPSGRAHSPKQALDIGKNISGDQAILAAADGVVLKTESLATSYGTYVVIEHDNGYYTRYAHLKAGSLTVKVGDHVTAGQTIGLMGNTGNSTGVHLHFEIGRSMSMCQLEWPLDYYLTDTDIWPQLRFAATLQNASKRYSALLASAYDISDGYYLSSNGTSPDLSLLGDSSETEPEVMDPVVSEPNDDPFAPIEEGGSPEPVAPTEDETVVTVSSSQVREALAATTSGDYLLIDNGTPSTDARRYVIKYAALTPILNSSSIRGIVVKDDYGSFTMDKNYATALIAKAGKGDVTFIMERSAGSDDVLMNYTMKIVNADGTSIDGGSVGRCLVEVSYAATGDGNALAIYDSEGVAQARCGYLADGSTLRWVFQYSDTYQLKNGAIDFNDVPSNQWYAKYIDFLSSKGVLGGMTATTFEPQGKVTRAQFVKILAVISGDDMTLYGDADFTDVSDRHWAKKYINWAADNGIVSGMGDNIFAPESNITREQMATMICRFAAYLNYEVVAVRDAVTFRDADIIAAWADDYVNTLYCGGVVSGLPDGRFNPQGNATRAEASTIAANLIAGLIVQL